MDKRKAIRAAVTAGGVLALVAVAAAVLIPARADYTERSQAAEAIALMGAARLPLAEHYQEHGRWPATIEAAGAQREGKYTQSVVMSKGAGGTEPAMQLTATMRKENVREAVAGRTIVMATSDGGLTWKCGPGTMDLKWLPATCRP